MQNPWTNERVRAGLIAAFRAAPSSPVMSPSRGDLVLAIGQDRTAEWDLISATYYSLGQDRTPEDRETRLMVLTWARVMAMDGGKEASLRDICGEMGWSFRTFLRRVDAGVEDIADHMEFTRKAMLSQIFLDGDTNGTVIIAKSQK